MDYTNLHFQKPPSDYTNSNARQLSSRTSAYHDPSIRQHLNITAHSSFAPSALALYSNTPAAGHPNGSLPNNRIPHRDHLHLATGHALGESNIQAKDLAARLCGVPQNYHKVMNTPNTTMTMDDLLAYERTAEAAALATLSHDIPLDSICPAYADYRAVTRAVMFGNFALAKEREAHLWAAHTAAKNYLSRQLKIWRRDLSQGAELAVQLRFLVQQYMRFIRHSSRFYKEHIAQLHTAFGLPELQEVAFQIHKAEQINKSIAYPGMTPELRDMVLESCHQSIIRLGDLSRWRAQDTLESKPDLGPAMGYYGLASTIRPQSGMGHHQLATIALKNPGHLRAVYHLYRATCVSEPHPLAKKHLETEFKQAQSAWAKGELIEKGPPNDPDARKKALLGWFVRLHTVCSRNDGMRGFEELEREVMGQLASELKKRSLDPSLNRMVLVNIAAQHVAIENYKTEQSSQNEQAFYAFLRINLRTYTTLLEVFIADLLDVARNPDMIDAELAEKIFPATTHVLAALRLYSAWLLLNHRLLFGLTKTPFLAEALKEFWKTYGRALDLVAANFDIFALEDVAPVAYMLEEDADVFGFTPFEDEAEKMADKLWYDKATGALKPRFSSASVVRASTVDENLTRVFGFLVDGLYVANDLEESPIKIRGVRVFYGDGDELEQLIMPATLQKPVEKPVQQAPQVTTPAVPAPLSYAAAAAAARNSRPAPKTIGTPNGAIPTLASGQTQHSQDARMSRMVDDLVDEPEIAVPRTPPQNTTSNPVIAQINGSTTRRNINNMSDWRQNATSNAKPNPISRPHSRHLSATPNLSPNPWTSPPAATSPRFVPSHPIGPLSSPAAQRSAAHHSRVNSAASTRSQNISDSWASLEHAPQGTRSSAVENGFHAVARNGVVTIPSISNAGDEAMLFGAMGGIWATGVGESGGSKRARWSFDAGRADGFGG